MENLFKIEQTGYYASKNFFQEKQTPIRIVQDYEIELYTTTGNISMINDVAYIQAAGNVLISIPGDVRYSIDAFECYCVHFSCSNEYICQKIKKLPKVFKYLDSKKLISVFDDISASVSSNNIAKDLFLSAKVIELISMLISSETVNYSGKYSHHFDKIYDACCYMEEKFNEKISLEYIAQKAHLSPTYFHIIFKDIMSVTPSEYLLNIRLSEAKKMLVNSTYSISDIAQACGFNDQAYFSYVFKGKLVQRQSSIEPLYLILLFNTKKYLM